MSYWNFAGLPARHELVAAVLGGGMTDALAEKHRDRLVYVDPDVPAAGAARLSCDLDLAAFVACP